MNDRRGRVFRIGILICVFSIAAAGAVAASSSPIGSALALENDTDGAEDSEEEIVRHRNPDEYDETMTAAQLEAWLEAELTGRLRASSNELRADEPDRAADPLDEEFLALLDRYAEVTDDPERTEALEGARDEQLELIEAIREYREIRSEYEDALEEDDDERARELARELEEAFENVEESGDSVLDRYGEIDTLDMDVDDLSGPEDEIATAIQEIRNDQARVTTEEFVETELVLETDDDEISYVDPLRATGTVRTADGSPIADEEVRIDVGNATERVETDEDGAFELEYRPTEVPASAETLPVTFVPENQPELAGTETTVDLSIGQVEPAVSNLETPSEVAYDDVATVRGELSAEGEPVDGVPIEVTLDGRQIGEASVTNGTFEWSGDVPRSVPPGETELGVRLGFEERALAQTAESEPVAVLETETDVSIAAARTEGGSIRAEGTLETADGERIDNESVGVRVDGSTVETVRTGPDGEFDETVPVPSSAEGDVSVAAVYDGSGSNLAGSQDETVVSLPGGDGSDGLRTVAPAWTWIGLALLGVLASVVGVRRFRRNDRVIRGGSTDETSPSPREPPVAASLLTQASEQLADGRSDVAVRIGYAAARQTLESRLEDGGRLTHWEFYRRFREGGDRDRPLDSDGVRSLRALTEGYERAAFDAEQLSPETAAALLERAERVAETDAAARSK